MSTACGVISNLDDVLKRVKNAAVRSGRDPQQIELLVVTKYAHRQDILTLLEENKITTIGETRVQQAISRWNSNGFLPYKDKVIKHFIGHLQSNKAKKAVEFFDFIDSVDSLKTALILNEASAKINKKISVLVQVKLTEKQTQSGIDPQEASGLVEEIRKMDNLVVRGYMAIAPITENPGELRPVFEKAKQLFDKDFPTATEREKNYLSLGMSSDFEVAVEEGSNLPRIGSAIFAHSWR